MDRLKNQKVSFDRFNSFIETSPWPLTSVPLIASGDEFKLNLEELKALSVDKYVTYVSSAKPNTVMEGIVVRSQDGEVSFKIINPEFLLKNNY